MRFTVGLVALAMTAGPALAQTPPPPPPPPADPLDIRIPPELTDPANAERLTGTMQALSDALLNLPVGEVRAAVEGRRATPVERRMTVRDLDRRDDPHFDRDMNRRIAEAQPMIRQSMKAMTTALPKVLQSLEQAGRAIEQATANLPSPTYPNR